MDDCDNQDSTKSTDDWIDNPKVVEILKKPNNSIQLSFDACDYLKNSNCKNNVHNKEKTYVYVPSKSLITINPNSGSWLKRPFVVKDLEKFCNELNIKELCIIRNDENMTLINKYIQSIKDKKWQGPRLCIIKGITKVNGKDDQKVILNDFHILPSSGHAGIRRMINNIKRHYYWHNMEKDVQNFVKRCEKCQKQKYHKNTKQPMCITSTASSAFENSSF